MKSNRKETGVAVIGAGGIGNLRAHSCQQISIRRCLDHGTADDESFVRGGFQEEQRGKIWQGMETICGHSC